jgi:hypothetical protein
MVSPSFGSLSTSTNMSALADPTTIKGALSVMMMMMNDDPHQTNPRGEERRGEERLVEVFFFPVGGFAQLPTKSKIKW